MDNQQKTAYTLFAAAALIIVGSFLAWATVSLAGISQSVGGMDGDGPITLVTGIALGVLGWLVYSGGWQNWIVTGIVALIAGGIAAIDMADVNSIAGDFPGVDANIGIGLWFVLLGAIVGLVGTWLQYQNRTATA